MWALFAVLALGSDPLEAKLEKIESGLNLIKKNSPAIEDLVQPMIDEARKARESHDSAAMQAAAADIPKWQAQLSERASSVQAAGDGERNSLLVAVLQNKQSETEATQLAVVNAHDFDGLPVVTYINEHHDGKAPLVTFALRFLDEQSKQIKPATAGPLDTIVLQLQGNAAKAKAKVEILDEHIKKIKGVFASMHGKAAQGELKFMEHKELRSIQKQRAFELTTEKALEKAIEDIEHHDVKGLKEAQAALKESMAAVEESEGHFLKLLQVEEPVQTFSCPYCGAQCLEKCNRDEPSRGMAGCLQECLTKDPKPPAF